MRYLDSRMRYEESKSECHHVVEGHSEEVTSGWYLNDDTEEKWQEVPSREKVRAMMMRLRKAGVFTEEKRRLSRVREKEPEATLPKQKVILNSNFGYQTHTSSPFCQLQFLFRFRSCSGCWHKMHEGEDIRSSGGLGLSPTNPEWGPGIQRAWQEESERLGWVRVSRALQLRTHRDTI